MGDPAWVGCGGPLRRLRRHLPLEGEDFENDDVLPIQGVSGPPPPALPAPPPGRGRTLRTMMASTFWGLQSAQVTNERKTVEPTSLVRLDRVVRSVSVSEQSDESGADPSICRPPGLSMPRPDSRPGIRHQPLNPANQCPSAPGPHRGGPHLSPDSNGPAASSAGGQAPRHPPMSERRSALSGSLGRAGTTSLRS